MLELMPHQKHAVAKMMATRVGALFMEMGTGKTRTALALIEQRRNRINNIVWFCPVSLKDTICKMITDDIGETPYVFDDSTTQDNLPRYRFSVAGIESMSCSPRMQFAARDLITPSTYVIVDESSFIKNSRAKRSWWINTISEQARYRLILNGTPITQGIEDLYGQMKFLSPQILGYTSFHAFARNHLEYSEKYPGMIIRAHNEEYLAAKMKPYVYQVTKTECLDLPPKLYERRYFWMTEEQQNAYRQAKDEFFECEGQYDLFNFASVMQLFTALQRVVNGYTKDEDDNIIPLHHQRCDELLDIIERIPAGDKVIIWCKFRYDIEQVSRALTGKYGDTVSLHYGNMSIEERAASIEAFRNRNRFFVSTEATGGFGLTLNEAHYVVFYNNQFKFSQRLQAEDRCHRIGQARPVTYIDLICADSIDERIMRSLRKKGDTLKEFMEEIDKVRDFKKRKAMVKQL